MSRWLVICLMATGCRQIWGLGETPDQVVDAPPVVIDAIQAPGDELQCFGSLLGQHVCYEAPPTLPLSLGTEVIDTDTDARCDAATGQACLLAATSIDVAGVVAATGKRPLVLFAVSTVTIAASGEIDVSSDHTGVVGAGGNPESCPVPIVLVGSGGGAGGSLGGVGGSGGAGTEQGGTSAAAQSVTTLRGGCVGSSGRTVASAGGPGGGAVYVLAGTSITIAGRIDASGGGGKGGSANQSGGGGGGSGGVIALDAPLIDLGTTGTVFANGGGGGAGGSALAAGDDGNEATSVAAAAGGAATIDGGAGGRGSSGVSLDGVPGKSNTSAGGGGGGAAGVIVSSSAITSTLISPPVTMMN